MKPTRRSRSAKREIIEFIGDSVDDFSRRGTAANFFTSWKCVNFQKFATFYSPSNLISLFASVHL